MVEPTDPTSSSRHARDEDEKRPSPNDAFATAAHHLAEAKEFAANYIAAKADSLRLSLRKIIVAVVLAVIGLIGAAAALVVAIVLLFGGLAHAIGDLFNPPKPWVGELIVGGTVLFGTVLAVMLVIRKMTRAGRNNTVKKYESKHVQQRRRFGRDVDSASNSTTN